MKKLAAIVLLMSMVALSRSFAATPDSNASQTADEKAVVTKANELLADKTARLDKISALHTFVRDEIGQAKTQYG